MRHCMIMVALCAAFFASAVLAAPTRPVVVELFTSQGCPSCPQADALLKQLAESPAILPLSFHVTYFDDDGWKDPYATPANNKRQQHYLRAVGMDSAFTPHIVVDGLISAAGSNANSVAQAIAEAQQEQTIIPVSIAPNVAGDGLDVIMGDSENPVPPDSILYEVHFNRSTITPIRAGGNDGLTVENVNNVIAIFPVTISAQYFVPMNSFAEDGIAYLLQSTQGRVLGAAYYMKP